MKARKLLPLLGILSILSLSFSPLFTSTAYANDTTFGGDEKTEAPLTSEKSNTLLNQVSDSENYEPASPNIQPDVKATEATDYTAPQNVIYPEFEGHQIYSLNPNTKPLTKASPEIINSYISKLSECNNFSEANDECVKSESKRYFLGVDTSDPIASTVDLMALAQDIEALTGIKTLVHTSNHLSTNATEISQTLIFSDHIELAREYVDTKSYNNLNNSDSVLIESILTSIFSVFSVFIIVFFVFVIAITFIKALLRG